MLNRVRCFLAIMLLVCGPAVAATINVERDGSGDFIVLQEALNAAADGDTIRLGPGDFTEMPWTRLPGWSWDVRSCGRVLADDLTIIGAGPELTRIGPATYAANGNLFSPIAIAYTERAGLRLQDLTIRNCYESVRVKGTLDMENCALDDHAIGMYWFATGIGGGIRDTEFRGESGVAPTAFRIIPDGGGEGILIERCDISGANAIIETPGTVVIDCRFSEYKVGVQIYGSGSATFHRCTVDVTRIGLEFSLGSGAYCEFNDGEISGGWTAMDAGGNAPNGRYVVRNSRLHGGSTAVIDARYRPRSCEISGCDIFKGSGPVILCSSTNTAVTHDLRNNYWGTTSEADIQSWIIDHSDDPNIPATVLYLPFVGMPVPTEKTTWGELKASFR